MNLLEIKNYLMRVKIASLSHLCSYFSCDSEVLRGMLSHWIRKGCIRQCVNKSACATKCATQCAAVKMELYEWVV